MEKSRTQKLRKINFWDKLLELRDKDRLKKENALVIVHGEDLPWEINRQGIMRWYLHPIMEDTVINPFIVYIQEIPPGSKSGRLKTPGGQIVYIWEGKGYTVMDGAKHPWEAGDVVQIPLRSMGVVCQHFNGDAKNPVRLISVDPNMVGALGIDRGCGFEQLENCPESKPSKERIK